MVELIFSILQIVKFYKIVNYRKLVNYYIIWKIGWFLKLEIIGIFLIRNFWNFLNRKFLGGIQNIEWSNVERPGFENYKITNIKITKDELFF